MRVIWFRCKYKCVKFTIESRLSILEMVLLCMYNTLTERDGGKFTIFSSRESFKNKWVESFGEDFSILLGFLCNILAQDFQLQWLSIKQMQCNNYEPIQNIAFVSFLGAVGSNGIIVKVHSHTMTNLWQWNCTTETHLGIWHIELNTP